MNVVIPIQHGGYTIRSWLYLKSSWLYPNIVVVITKLLCQIEFYQWLAQYDTDRCVSCYTIHITRNTPIGAVLREPSTAISLVI